MGDSMKLDKWPEEVEVDGWRWERNIIDEFSPKRYVQYRSIEKLHAPPTMREIMEHLLKGGWVRFGDSNSCYYYRIEEGELQVNTEGRDHGFVEKKGPFNRQEENRHLFFLIRRGEWFEGEGK